MLRSWSFGLRSWLLRAGALSPVLGLCPVVSAVSAVVRARLLVGSVRDDVPGSVWPPHVCTKEPASVSEGASAARLTGRGAVVGAVWRPANAQERWREHAVAVTGRARPSLTGGAVSGSICALSARASRACAICDIKRRRAWLGDAKKPPTCSPLSRFGSRRACPP